MVFNVKDKLIHDINENSGIKNIVIGLMDLKPRVDKELYLCRRNMGIHMGF